LMKDSGEDEFLGKYAKLAILATLCEPKSLSELGIFWYKENGRFYKIKAREEINLAVKKSLLLRQESKLIANTNEIISRVYSGVKDKELKADVLKFWQHPFSQSTYLCCDAIKHMFNKDAEKAAAASMSLIMNLPLLLHQLQEKHEEAYTVVVTLQSLDDYTQIINTKSDENINKIFMNLKQKTDWLDNLNRIVKSNGYLIRQIKEQQKKQQQR
jgi:hypothetical protein